jgi:hypothetical protein
VTHAAGSVLRATNSFTPRPTIAPAPGHSGARHAADAYCVVHEFGDGVIKCFHLPRRHTVLGDQLGPCFTPVSRTHAFSARSAFLRTSKLSAVLACAATPCGRPDREQCSTTPRAVESRAWCEGAQYCRPGIPRRTTAHRCSDLSRLRQICRRDMLFRLPVFNGAQSRADAPVPLERAWAPVHRLALP